MTCSSQHCSPSLASPSLSTDEQYSIDVEIIQLQEHSNEAHKVYGLRRRRNMLALVGKLPSEILIQIFLLLIPRREHPWRLDRDHMLITHVCHNWREEALRFPLLWSTILLDKTPLAWVKEYVRRSQKSPLEIYGEFDSTSLLMTMETMKAKLAFLRSLIEKSGPRIKDLTIRSYGRELNEIRSLISHAAVHAQNIEALSIHYGVELRFSNLAFNKEPIDLLPIFQGDLMKLRSLTIVGFPTRWPADASSSAFLSKQLTTLHLKDVSAISTNNLLDIISLTPTLQILDLANRSRPDAETDPDSDLVLEDRIVPLERLARFIFSGPLRRCLALLAHIRYPLTSTHIDLTVDPDAEPFLPLSLGVEQLFQFCGTIVQTPPRGFEVDIDLHWSMTFRFYDQIRRIGGTTVAVANEMWRARWVEPIVTVAVCSIEPSQDLLESLLSTLPLSSVDQLGLSGSISHEMVCSVMSSTPRATRVKLSSYNIHPHYSALCERVEDKSFLYLPLLTDIWISQTDFMYFQNLGPLGCAPWITHILTRRDDGGARVQRLHLSDNLYLSEEMVRAMFETGAVDEVVWGDLMTQNLNVFGRDSGSENSSQTMACQV